MRHSGNLICYICIHKKQIMKKIIILLLLSLSINVFGQSDSSNINITKPPGFTTVIPIEIVKGKIIIKAEINGKSYRFILDTGSLTLISKRLFDELNPENIQKVYVSDQSGKRDSIDVVKLEQVTIGEFAINNAEAFALKEYNPLVDCFDVDGFIGSNMLSCFVVQFSFRDSTVTLATDPQLLTLHEKQSSELIIDGQFSPHFTIKLKKNKKEAQQVVLFDTGDDELYRLSHQDYTTLKKDGILDFKGVANGANSIGLLGNAVDTTHYRLKVPTLEMNGLQYKNVSTITTQGSSRIGSEILKNAIVTLDFQNKKYYIQPISSSKIDAYESKLPFDPDIRDGKAVVGFIWDNSICKNINVGDEILTINDFNFQNIKPCDLLNKEFSLKGAKKVTMTTKDKAGIIHTTIFRKK